MNARHSRKTLSPFSPETNPLVPSSPEAARSPETNP